MAGDAYFTEDAKMYKSPNTRWTFDECIRIHDILASKGYFTNCVSRIGCDRKPHDALQVERKDMPRLIEQCFRQRLVVEVQAEGHGKASINFVYDYHGSDIISRVRRFQRNKEVEQ